MSTTVQVFEASAAYQAMVLAAAIDSGAFPPADRRILLTSVNSAVPEASRRFEDDPAVAPLLTRFDSVASWNDLIAPLHPKAFRPRADELPLFLRAFRRELGIPEDALIELALESVQTPPARTILSVFAESPATVYAEGLMSYGPTRDPLGHRMWGRIDRVLHLDLVPGLRPLLLSEHDVRAEPVAPDAFRAVVRELAARRTAAPRPPHALILGQYLAPLGLLPAAEEAALYGDLVEAAVGAGFGDVVYKPHPSAPAAYAQALRARAEQVGARLTVETDPAPAEVLYEADPPGLVLGCFSTGLVTAARYWGLPVAAAGTGRVLDALPRYEDSNRVPLLLVDLTVPHAARSDGAMRIAPSLPLDDGRAQQLLGAVGYAMQWRAHARTREAVTTLLEDPASEAHRYIPVDRRDLLRLPGGTRAALAAPDFERALLVRARIEEARGVAGSAVRRLRALARR